MSEFVTRQAIRFKVNNKMTIEEAISFGREYILKQRGVNIPDDEDAMEYMMYMTDKGRYMILNDENDEGIWYIDYILSRDDIEVYDMEDLVISIDDIVRITEETQKLFDGQLDKHPVLVAYNWYNGTDMPTPYKPKA